MRARAAKQRFPVAQWVENLGILQSTAIRLHKKVSNRSSRVKLFVIPRTPNSLTKVKPEAAQNTSTTDIEIETLRNEHEYILEEHSDQRHSSFRPEISTTRSSRADFETHLQADSGELPEAVHYLSQGGSTSSFSANYPHLISSTELSSPSSYDTDDGPSTPRPQTSALTRAKHLSTLSLASVVGEKTNMNLQKVDPFFSDSNGKFSSRFERKLSLLNGQNSLSHTCIEDYIKKSEKEWFSEFRIAKMSRAPKKVVSVVVTEFEPHASDSSNNTSSADIAGEFVLHEDYTPPTGLKKWMQFRLGDWPAYALVLAFGQIISANSYQITLLTGEIGQSAKKLYLISVIYLTTSIIWWVLYRRVQAVLTLSLPFAFYGLSFLLIGLAHCAHTASRRDLIQNVGVGLYAVASSSGSVFFALNFGDDGGATVSSWVFRGCVIQGSQQIYIALLWYWGSHQVRHSATGIPGHVTGSWIITVIALTIAFILWIIGLITCLGLPSYYRQAPGKTASFYTSLLRRNIVLWFFLMVIVQNFTLSAPYGRNWKFLFSSNHAQDWQIILLVLLFFVAIWAALCWSFSYLSKSHLWILPLFATGIGSPRWAQIWWGTSNVGLWLPWAGVPVAGALLSRALWLWLGVLDAVQGVGLGMILLSTLTRSHVAFTLICAQVLGSTVTIAARACAPNKIGPGPVHPDISGGAGSLGEPWFWIGLFCNWGVCAGFTLFFRKEQLSKP